MSNKKGNYKVEFENSPDGILEIRYFDDSRDLRYRSWKLPREVAKELISWWGNLRNDKNTGFPIKEKTKICEFNRPTDQYINIGEFDSLGRFKMTGWNLPRTAVERLTDWHEKQNITNKQKQL